MKMAGKGAEKKSVKSADRQTRTEQRRRKERGKGTRRPSAETEIDKET